MIGFALSFEHAEFFVDPESHNIEVEERLVSALQRAMAGESAERLIQLSPAIFG